ncbi:hypothetical protein F4860DRAFT_474086 [Xylaria cubensis]|nr:hypothetical protein F4860DRAFT_474086 [Xylaria cubensis]
MSHCRLWQTRHPSAVLRLQRELIRSSYVTWHGKCTSAGLCLACYDPSYKRGRKKSMAKELSRFSYIGPTGRIEPSPSLTMLCRMRSGQSIYYWLISVLRLHSPRNPRAIWILLLTMHAVWDSQETDRAARPGEMDESVRAGVPALWAVPKWISNCRVTSRLAPF